MSEWDLVSEEKSERAQTSQRQHWQAANKGFPFLSENDGRPGIPQPINYQTSVKVKQKYLQTCKAFPGFKLLKWEPKQNKTEIT